MSSDDKAKAIASIKDCVEELLGDENAEEYLKEFCQNFKEGNYMLLNNDDNNEYWIEKAVKDHKRSTKRERIEEAIRCSKRIKEKNKCTKDEMIKERSVIATKIKRLAYKTLEENPYNKLNIISQNTISNGFNSILDLSDNNISAPSQRSLFSSTEWKNLKEKYDKEFKWTSLDRETTSNLKDIEKLAEEDTKAAYKKCLKLQLDYALTDNERYYKIYANMLHTIYHHPDWLEYDNKNNKFSEQDYSTKIWAPIIENMFNDNLLFTKWGETVSKDSTESKKINGNKNSSGDKVDVRICYKNAKPIDLINGEFANNCTITKHFKDHRKIIREVKNISDLFYCSKYLKNKIKKNIKARCFQIAGKNGEIIEVKLVEDGLYVARKLGSLRLPTSEADLKKLRVVIERLAELRKFASGQTRLYRMMLEEEEAVKKNMDSKKNQKQSPYDDNEEEKENKKKSADDNYCTWIRGSWFPPPESDYTMFDGKLFPYLTKSPYTTD